MMLLMLYSTTAKRGPCQLCRKRKLTPSTNDASVVLLDLSGDIRLPTKKCWDDDYHYIHHPQPAQALLARSCFENERRAHPINSELVIGKRNVGRPRLCYKDVCKNNLKSLKILTLMVGKGLRKNWTNGALLSWRDKMKGKTIFLRNQRMKEPEWIYLYFYILSIFLMYLLCVVFVLCFYQCTC